jgi:hypothetical protein
MWCYNFDEFNLKKFFVVDSLRESVEARFRFYDARDVHSLKCNLVQTHNRVNLISSKYILCLQPGRERKMSQIEEQENKMKTRPKCDTKKGNTIRSHIRLSIKCHETYGLTIHKYRIRIMAQQGLNEMAWSRDPTPIG